MTSKPLRLLADACMLILGTLRTTVGDYPGLCCYAMAIQIAKMTRGEPRLSVGTNYGAYPVITRTGRLVRGARYKAANSNSYGLIGSEVWYFRYRRV